jgi:uncharacterized Zn-finger protein
MNTNAQTKAVELQASELPAFCPNKNMPVWNHHPRVFLDVSHGPAACSYCGTVYQLKAGETLAAH